MVQVCNHSLTGSREILCKPIVLLFSSFPPNKCPDLSVNVSWSVGKTTEINSKQDMSKDLEINTVSPKFP